MRPARLIKQAEEAARRLKALLSSSIMSQLQHRTPPAAVNAEQEAQLSRCCSVITQLSDAFVDAPSLKKQLLDAMLKQQVASDIGSLVAWVQQQPEQQRLDLTAVAGAGHQGSAPVAFAAGAATAPIWADGVHLLDHFAAAALHTSPSAGACTLAKNLTQQLAHSGKAYSCKCKCTVR
jgi:hypothetical protein